MRYYILFIISFLTLISQGQVSSFKNATEQFNLPNGVLEAVAYSNTRFHHLDSTHRCSGLPVAYSIMGLIENGQGYFQSNLRSISAESGYSISSIKSNADSSIFAYASVLNNKIDETSSWKEIFKAIGDMSEFPTETIGQQYAMEAFLYQVFDFLSRKKHQSEFNFPSYGLDGFDLFGSNFNIHSSKKVIVDGNKIGNKAHNFQSSFYKNSTCNDYANSTFISADPSNYSSRSGTAISAITIHDIEGSYAGCISWFQNPSANVSAHYVLRSSDGQITQMVCEADKAWHVGNSNPYAIGFEHEGYAAQEGWYTEEMYQASADLARDICNSGYGINPLRTYNGPECLGSSSQCELGACIRIKGHQHYPGQSHTDPGIYWDWPYFYQLINQGATSESYTNSTGTILDSGGEPGNYADDERLLYLIQSPAMASVSLNFETLDIEDGWDYIRLYDGNSTLTTPIRTYTGNSLPNDTTVETEALLIEFTSDCATNLTGYKINYSSTAYDTIKPTTLIANSDNFKTEDFNVVFTDSDNSGFLSNQFMNVSYLESTRKSNTSTGQFLSDFSNINEWIPQSGNWTIATNVLAQMDESENNSNLFTGLNQNDENSYLYEFDLRINGSIGNRRAGFHFMADSAAYENRKNSYFVFLREEDDKFQLYKVDEDVFSLVQDIPFTINENQWYNIKVIYDKTEQIIKSFINDSIVNEWHDDTPISIGNYISFRTGNSQSFFKELTVYTERGNTELIRIGTEPEDQIMNQSSLLIPEVGFIKSIIVDTSDNLSEIVSESYKIDWTAPIISIPSDDQIQDADTSYQTNQLGMYWEDAIDTNSGISHYEFTLGTLQNPSSGSTMQATTATGFTFSGLDLDYDSTYYIYLKAINGANMESTSMSDGILILDPLAISEFEKIEVKTFPNPTIDNLHVEATTQFDGYIIQDVNGKIILQSRKKMNHSIINLSQIASGTYFILLKKGQQIIVKKFKKI